MPFLILPRSRNPSTGQLDALAERLCPYDGPPCAVLETADHVVWGSSLMRAQDGEVAPDVAGGTARVVIRREGEGLRLQTDPFGTCPLWFVEEDDGCLVSPEAKALAVMRAVTLRPDAELLAPGTRPPDWSPFEPLRRLAPGASLALSRGAAVVAGAPPELPEPGQGTDDLDGASALAAALLTSWRPGDAPVGAFVSGGIDSSFACAVARRSGPVRAFSLGTCHGDEFDGARALAAGLDCPLEEVELDEARALRLLDDVVHHGEVFDGLAAEILVQVAALGEAAAGSCRRVVTGYGSDLLFDGMLRHEAYMAAVGLSGTRQLIERTRWTGELAPFVTWAQGLAVEHLFWSPEVVDAALRVPRQQCFRGGVEKDVLRRAAVGAGLLSEPLAYRPKTGLSDGTGANRLLSRALGLAQDHAYREKSLACIERLRRVL